MIDMSLQEIAGMIENKISRERLEAVEQFVTKYNNGLNNKIYSLDQDNQLQDEFHKGVREGLVEAKNLLEQIQELCKNTLRA